MEPEGARAGAVNRVKRKNATPPHARSSGGRSLLGHSGEEVQCAVPNAMVSGSIVCCGEEQGMPRRRRTWWSTGHSLHAWSRAVRFSIIQMPRAAENRSRELRYARFRRVKSQKGRPPVREKLRGTLPAGPLWREVKRVAPNACARWAEMTGRFWKKRRSQIMRATPAMRMEANSRAWDEPNLQNSCTSQAIEPSPSRLRAFPLSPFDLWRGQRVGQGSLPRNSLVKPSKLPPFERPNQNFGKEPKNFNQGRGISCDHYAYCKATRPRQEPFESFAAAEPSSQCLCEACAMKIM